MAKSVFHPHEITPVDEKVILKLSHTFIEEEPLEEIDEIPDYTGPTADDLRREAEEYKKQFELEKQAMFEEAQIQAEQIIRDAEAAAFDEVKRKTDQVQDIKQQAEKDAESLLENAHIEAAKILAEAKQNKDEILSASRQEGYAAGREEGFQNGSLEAKRLVERLHTVVEKIMDKRQEILADTEQQIVDLVLLMTRKVVKIISENQRNVVMANILQALRKVKGRGDVVIRVNLADIGLATEHTKEFMNAVESVKNITLLEDSTVDRGGCIVETDFGSIDARIASQLNELEQKILEISPIRTNAKTAVTRQDL